MTTETTTATTAPAVRRLYVPQGATTMERHGGIVYLYQSDSGVPYAVGYRGRAYKPAFHFRFASEERRTAHVEAFCESLQRQAAVKAERRQAFATPHTLKVGDVVVNSWGWEQTNIDFYEVVKTSANYVWLLPLSAEEVEQTGFMQGKKMPRPGQHLAEVPTKHRVYHRDTGASVNFKHGCGYLWDGTPEWYSCYA
jgi:hypothetical protein